MLRIRCCNIWLCVRGGYVKYIVWRPISNTDENMANIMSTGCGGHGDGYKDLMEEDSTYSASVCLLMEKK